VVCDTVVGRRRWGIHKGIEPIALVRRREMANENSMVADDLIMRTRHAMLALKDCVEVNTQKRLGAPILKGTRFTVSQLLAELAEGRSVVEIADDFDLSQDTIRKLLDGLALCLDGLA
jgi:uncharacterized protein (DUF433 family)